MKGLATTIYKSKTAFIAKANPIEVSEKIKSQNLNAYVVDVVTCYDGIIDVEHDVYCLAYESKPSEQLKLRMIMVVTCLCHKERLIRLV